MAKLPKNRATVFVVIRTVDMQVGFQHVKIQPTVVGVYFSLSRAEEIAGRYKQEMDDKGFTGINFEVMASAFYDE